MLQVRSPRPDGRPTRLPNAPKLYLPPIGVRLVEKYVGFDIKRRKSLFEHPSRESSDQMIGEQRNSLPQVRRSFRNILMKKSVPIVISKPSGHLQGNHIESKKSVFLTQDETEVSEQPAEVNNAQEAITMPENGIETSERADDKRSDKRGTTTEHSAKNNVDIQHGCQKENVQETPMQRTTNDNKGHILPPEREDTGGGLVFYTAERRSSRSTYRKRNSARLLTGSEALRQHNLKVIADKGYLKTSKTSLVNTDNSGSTIQEKPTSTGGMFFLDYGDGKLHTTMEIPKTKDCARSWCSPTCRSCQTRTNKKPCFILIPSGNQDRQSMLLVQKRRASIIAVCGDDSGVAKDDDKTNIDKDTGNDKDAKEMTDSVPADTDHTVKLNEKDEDEAAENDNEQANGRKNGIEIDNTKEDVSDTIIPEIEKLLLINRNRVRKGYDKDRIDQLAQPRGGHPAEVRFSKWSLRNKREQLKEKARTAQLSEMEKDNLSMIQGKISLFLAVLNQCESTSVPKMVHLPIRETVYVPRFKKRKKRDISGRKIVGFKPKPRVRLMS